MKRKYSTLYLKEKLKMDRIVTLAKNLKELREQNNLRQEDVADIVDSSQKNVSNWEIGKFEPDIQTLWKLADYFDVTIDYLVGRSDL